MGTLKVDNIQTESGSAIITNGVIPAAQLRSSGVGKILLNGLEVLIKKIKKPTIIICWNNKVKILYFFGCWLDLIKKIEINKVNTSNHSNKLPSWLPQVPEIL